jgi:uncharacterized protein involved in exopolysaccharide biosynthesis
LLRSKQYEAITVLSPALDEAASSRMGGLGALASQYGGLASLAGLSVGSGGKREESIATLQSELLTERYIEENDLLPVLYASQWDSHSKKWKSTKVPTVWKANRDFKRRIRDVTDEKKTGLVYLTIKWNDPDLAAQWANDLVKLTNSYLRSKAIQEAERNIAYLNEQAAKTDIVEARRAIYSLLQDEINKQMVARGREEYALKVLDPAVSPEKPTSFGPPTLAALGLLVGFFAAMLFILARRVLQSAW